MKSILKKTGTIALIATLGFVAVYTFTMGFFFSFTGMWISDTGLMCGYALTFIVSASFLLYFSLGELRSANMRQTNSGTRV